MEVDELLPVIETWVDVSNQLRQYKWVQIFENRGKMMGCSNPHPHGQVWATSFLPNLPEKADTTQRNYYQVSGQCVFVSELSVNSRKLANVCWKFTRLKRRNEESGQCTRTNTGWSSCHTGRRGRTRWCCCRSLRRRRWVTFRPSNASLLPGLLLRSLSNMTTYSSATFHTGSLLVGAFHVTSIMPSVSRNNEHKIKWTWCNVTVMRRDKQRFNLDLNSAWDSINRPMASTTTTGPFTLTFSRLCCARPPFASLWSASRWRRCRSGIWPQRRRPKRCGSYPMCITWNSDFFIFIKTVQTIAVLHNKNLNLAEVRSNE